MKYHFLTGRLSPKALRILLVSCLVFLLVAVLAWVLFEPLRVFVAVPLEFLAWLLKTLYLMVPRYLWWVIFLVLAYIIAFNGLMGKTSRISWHSSQATESFAEPRVARLARYVRLRNNPFYHHRVNHQVTEVALHVLAYQENRTLHQTRLGIDRNVFGLPAEINQFLKAGLPPWPDLPFSPPHLLDRLFPSRKPKVESKIEAEQVLDYLEDALEVPRDD